MSYDYIPVRVAPEVLEKVSKDGSGPVVILGIEERPDGTHEMFVRTTVEVAAARQAFIAGLVAADAVLTDDEIEQAADEYMRHSGAES